MEMDNNVLFNIIQKADPDVGASVLVAGGKEYFSTARAFDLIKTVPHADTINMMFDVTFRLMDDSQIPLIKFFFEDAYLVKTCDETNTYQIFASNNAAFMRGLVYLHSCQKTVIILDDVRLEVPDAHLMDQKHFTILELVNGAKVLVKSVKHNMYYLSIHSMVTKTLR